jgi:hypothetical protein
MRKVLFSHRILSTHAPKFKLMISVILLAALARIATPALMGYLPNFSTVDATALFCGAYFARKSMAYLAILCSVWLSDLLISKIYMGHWTLFYDGFYWQYGCYVLITTLGFLLKKRMSFSHLALASLSSSFLFFVISNFGVWTGGYLYPLTLDGLIQCYIAALPFFKNSIFSDLFFSLSLFLSIEFIQIQQSSKLIQSR